MDCFAVLSFYILQCSGIFFAGADLYDSVNIVYKNLAIADVTGKEYLLCSCNDGINRDLADDNLDLYLRQQGCIDFCTRYISPAPFWMPQPITCVMVIPVTPRSFNAVFSASKRDSFAMMTTL